MTYIQKNYFWTGTHSQKSFGHNDEMQQSQSVIIDLPICYQLESFEVTTMDILQLSPKMVKISRIWNEMMR